MLTPPVTARDHIQGSLDASVVLVEYGDYECLYCGEAYPVVKELQQRLADQLCFAFRNFPLATAHPHAESAAEAAEAAGAQGMFWEMHDVLYENQRALEEEMERVKQEIGEDDYAKGRFPEAIALFRDISLAPEFVEFLTIPAYGLIA